MKIKSLCHLVLPAVAAFSLHAQELPAPWKQTDVGTAEVGKMTKIAGAAKHADGVFTLVGTMDLWGPADGLHFVWQPVRGDVVFIARVTSMDNPGGVGHAKASLCLRESLDGGSRCVTQCTTPGDGTHGFYFGLPRTIPETAESTRRAVAFIKKHFAAAAKRAATRAMAGVERYLHQFSLDIPHLRGSVVNIARRTSA